MRFSLFRTKNCPVNVYKMIIFYFSFDADVKNRWEKSSWGRKLIVQKKRASLNDFDRFKVMLAKIKVLTISVSLLFFCLFFVGSFILLVLLVRVPRGVGDTPKFYCKMGNMEPYDTNIL